MALAAVVPLAVWTLGRSSRPGKKERSPAFLDLSGLARTKSRGFRIRLIDDAG
jgi:hypothetical protein